MASTSTSQFEWYSKVPKESPLEQGDFINDFPIPLPPIEAIDVVTNNINESIATTEVRTYDVVVLTQSCDLLTISDPDEVILCPRHDYIEMAEKFKQFKNKDGWNKLLAGRFIGAHLINKCAIEDYEFDYQIINLKAIFPLPFSYVKKFVLKQGDRIRMLPPYREYLSQAFARQFMRIGLPIDLPKEYPYK